MDKSLTRRARRTGTVVLLSRVVDTDPLEASPEGGTASVLQRDLSLMVALCEAFGGRVVRRGSRGVEAAFLRPEDAFDCAQEIRRQLAEYARALPEWEVLGHRLFLFEAAEGGVEEDEGGPASAALGVIPPHGIGLSPGVHEALTRTRDPNVVKEEAGPDAGPFRHVSLVVSPGTGAEDLRPAPDRRAFGPLSIVGVGAMILLVAGVAIALTSLRRGAMEEVPLTNLAKPPAPAPAPKDSVPQAPLESGERRGVPQAQKRAEETARAPAPRREGPFAGVERKPAAGGPGRAVGTAPRSQGSGGAPAERGAPSVAAPSRSAVPSDDVALFRELDFNRDGKLSRHEIPFELRDKIMRADADGDGMVTLEEFSAARATRRGTPNP